MMEQFQHCPNMQTLWFHLPCWIAVPGKVVNMPASVALPFRPDTFILQWWVISLAFLKTPLHKKRLEPSVSDSHAHVHVLSRMNKLTELCVLVECLELLIGIQVAN